MTQRSDAQRNREKILTAAQRVFATHGTDVSLEQVYTEAGVGRATFYRNFSNREELIFGIYERFLERLEALARAEDAGSLRRVLHGYAVQTLHSPNLISVFAEDRGEVGSLAPLRGRYLRFVEDVLSDAIDRGEVPPRTTIDEFHVLLAMIQGASLLVDTPDARSRLHFALEVIDAYLGCQDSPN